MVDQLGQKENPMGEWQVLREVVLPKGTRGQELKGVLPGGWPRCLYGTARSAASQNAEFVWTWSAKAGPRVLVENFRLAGTDYYEDALLGSVPESDVPCRVQIGDGARTEVESVLSIVAIQLELKSLSISGRKGRYFVGTGQDNSGRHRGWCFNLEERTSCLPARKTVESQFLYTTQEGLVFGKVRPDGQGGEFWQGCWFQLGDGDCPAELELQTMPRDTWGWCTPLRAYDRQPHLQHVLVHDCDGPNVQAAFMLWNAQSSRFEGDPVFLPKGYIAIPAGEGIGKNFGLNLNTPDAKGTMFAIVQLQGNEMSAFAPDQIVGIPAGVSYRKVMLCGANLVLIGDTEGEQRFFLLTQK